VETILKAAPQIRVVLIRQNGLWGSRFSYGFYQQSQAPDFAKGVLIGIKYLVCNAFFFMPRRKLLYEFVEPLIFQEQQSVEYEPVYGRLL